MIFYLSALLPRTAAGPDRKGRQRESGIPTGLLPEDSYTHSFRFSRSAFEVGSIIPGTKVRISARRFQPLRWSKHATFRAPTLLWRTPIFSGFSTSARRSSARNRSSESELVGRISRRHSQAQNSSEKCRPRSLPSQKFPPQQHGHRPVEEQSWSVHPVTVKASITLRCTTIDARAAGPPTVFALPRCKKVDANDEAADASLSLPHVLSNCWDFAHEKTALTHLVESRGHILRMCVKGHPELAGVGIEYSWGKAKQKFRRDVNDRVAAHLHANIVKCFSRVDKFLPLARVRKFARKTRAYRRAYREGVDNVHACIEKMVKKFKAHRNAKDFAKAFIQSS